MAEQMLENMRQELLVLWQMAINEKDSSSRSTKLELFYKQYRRFKIQEAIVREPVEEPAPRPLVER